MDPAIEALDVLVTAHPLVAAFISLRPRTARSRLELHSGRLCPGCSRHVKRSDATCPFCGASASVKIGPTRTLAGRLSRAALLAAGAMGTAVTTTACGAKESSASDGRSVAAPDAGDASTTEPTDSSTASEDAPSLAAPYGAPPYGNVPVEE
jgi:hypothetical protein